MKRNKRIHPRRSAEVSKPVVIAVIAVLAILGLSLLVYFSDVFVGKAFEIQPQALNLNEVGFALTANAVEGDTLNIPLRVNIGNEKSTVFYFDFIYSDNILTPDCSKIFDILDGIFAGSNDLTIIKNVKQCSGGKIVFEYAALGEDASKKYVTGSKEIAQITFKANNAGITLLAIQSVDVYSLNTGNKTSVTPKDATITITAKQEKVCPLGQLLCNNQCVDTQSDKNNCGSCGNVCSKDQNCVAGKCTSAATCNDKIKNQDETDVDCGGSCPTKCEAGKSCNQDGDCASNDCEAGVCKAPVVLPKCGDNEQNQPTEECDGADLITKECKVLDPALYESGTLSCADDCKFDTSSCVLKPTTTMKGKKITLIDVKPVNNFFSTKIIADEGFTQGVMVYSVLYGSDNVVLSWKYDWIKSGVFSEKGKTYTAEISYDQSDVKKKVVIAFDKEGPGQQVYGTLPQDYP